MKIWIITTKQEEFRLFNQTHHHDLKQVIDFEVIFVENLNDLRKIQKGDTAFIRTKNAAIIDYILIIILSAKIKKKFLTNCENSKKNTTLITIW